jgi:hypothetical protein
VYAQSAGDLLECETTWHRDAYGTPLTQFSIKLLFYMEPPTVLRLCVGSRQLYDWPYDRTPGAAFTLSIDRATNVVAPPVVRHLYPAMNQIESLHPYSSLTIDAALFVVIILFNELGFQLGKFVQEHTNSELKGLTGSIQASMLRIRLGHAPAVYRIYCLSRDDGLFKRVNGQTYRRANRVGVAADHADRISYYRSGPAPARAHPGESGRDHGTATQR